MIDWTEAFDNSSHVPEEEAIMADCIAAATAFRDTQGDGMTEHVYGADPRQRFDLFRPDGTARGLIVFVHGGYWHVPLDKSAWSHFAGPAQAAGWAVAIPSFRLAPQVRIAEIVRDVAQAIDLAAELVDGPIRLIGHSAGGQLVARMVCEESPLAAATAVRVELAIPVSGIHDLRPLLLAAMNDKLRLNSGEADAESPALLAPSPESATHLWVGAQERPELLRQTRLLGEAWAAKGARIAETFEPGQNHFSVITALADPDRPLTRLLTSGRLP